MLIVAWNYKEFTQACKILNIKKNKAIYVNKPSRLKNAILTKDNIKFAWSFTSRKNVLEIMKAIRKKVAVQWYNHTMVLNRNKKELEILEAEEKAFKAELLLGRIITFWLIVSIVTLIFVLIKMYD